MKKALLLGSGFVAKPCLDHLHHAGINVTVGGSSACRTLDAAKRLAYGVTNVTPISLDATNGTVLELEISKHDIVISLIPYIHHASVIKAAIAARKHVVTTSYVSSAILELDEAAKEAGITVLNEIGLDPGIDHLYAVRMIDFIHAEGGKVVSFLSYCGGLPAPEASDNPLGYKFSWSSRGVLLALRNMAKYWEDGAIQEVSGQRLMETAKPYFIYPGFAFVAYPNRDSTTYKERYNIPEAQTIIRGTLRYQGFPEFIRVLVDIGLLSEEPVEYLRNPIPWKCALARVLGSSSETEENLIGAICSKAKFKDNLERDRVISGLRWIGLFSDTKITPRESPLDTICATLEEKMQYAENERDMVMLQHRFEIELKDGKREVRTSTLIEYGDPKGYSAMARLVGIPCAVAAKNVLDGSISETGILAPLKSEIVKPMIDELNKLGIGMVEKTLD